MKRVLFTLCLLLISAGAQAASRFWVPAPVTGAVSGTAGVCRLTVPGTNGYVTGNTITVASVGGATGCNVTTTLTVVDGTHIELAGTTFGGVYTSGGLVSGGNWTATNTANWAASSESTTVNQSVPGSGDTITFDGASGGATVIPNVTVTSTSMTIGAFTGTLDFSVNNNNVNLTSTGTSFSFGGSGTKTLKLGNGTWTITGSWDQTGGTTNLTFVANSSTITFLTTAASGTARTVNLGSVTYNIVTIGSSTGSGITVLGVGATVATLNLTGPNFIKVSTPATLTITGAINATLTNTTPITFDTNGNIFTISSSAALSTSWVHYHATTFSGGGSLRAINGFDLMDNTGITFGGAGGGCILGG